MKKIIFLLVMMAAMLSFNNEAKAQKVITLPLAAGDTVTNTGASSKVFTLTAGWRNNAIVQISGRDYLYTSRK
jgi:hypothetical protein